MTKALDAAPASPQLLPGEDRAMLRRLVDIVWNEATESTEVPSTKWADRLIDKAIQRLYSREMGVENEHAKPHPRWKPDNGSDRHPQTADEWDYRNDPFGGAAERSERRLNVAADYDDPRAPDQMALVLRVDLSRIKAELIHKRAFFEMMRDKTPVSPSLPVADEAPRSSTKVAVLVNDKPLDVTDLVDPATRPETVYAAHIRAKTDICGSYMMLRVRPGEPDELLTDSTVLTIEHGMQFYFIPQAFGD